MTLFVYILLSVFKIMGQQFFFYYTQCPWRFWCITRMRLTHPPRELFLKTKQDLIFSCSWLFPSSPGGELFKNMYKFLLWNLNQSKLYLGHQHCLYPLFHADLEPFLQIVRSLFLSYFSISYSFFFFSHSFLEGHVYWCIKAQELEPSKVEFKNRICYILVTFSRFLTLKFSLLMCFSQENTHYFYLWKRLKTSGSCTGKYSVHC